MPSDAIPNTAPYLYLGLAAIVVIVGAFLGTLVTRYRNLQRDLQQIEAYAKEERK